MEDFLGQMQQIKKMGSLGDMLKKIPGVGRMVGMQGGGVEEAAQEELRYTEAIINSMTVYERRNPKIINGSRRRRIAVGSGTSVQDVNALLRDFEKMKKMMKSMQKMSSAGRMIKGLPGR